MAIRDGKIAAIESSLPAEKARDVIDARGLYVVPGLVDMHTHIYYLLVSHKEMAQCLGQDLYLQHCLHL